MVFVDRVVTGAYSPSGNVKDEKPFMNEPVVEAEPVEEKPVEKPKKRNRKRAD